MAILAASAFLLPVHANAAPAAADQATCGAYPRLAVTTPAGFCVAVLTKKFKFARGIQPLPNGDIIVVDMGGWTAGQGSVWLLRQAPGEYERTLLIKGLDRPNGVVLGPDKLVYVGVVGGIFRFDPANPAATRKDVIGGGSGIAALPGRGRHALTSMRFDSKGDLFVNVGSSSDHCESEDNNAPAANQPCAETLGANPLGVIRKYRMTWPAGSVATWETYATGLRNSMALAFQPNNGALWQAENSRDAIHAAIPGMKNDNELPHDELNLIQRGQAYGWPYCYDDGKPSPEYPGAKCDAYRAPARLLPAHAAPLGMLFYTGSRFPQRYRESLIIGYHGYRQHGHRLVAALPDASGAPRGALVDLISDWGSKPNQAMGAPVDVKQGTDGNIYLAEDHSGRVIRLEYGAARK